MRVEVDVGMEEAALAMGADPGALASALARAGVPEGRFLDDVGARVAADMLAAARAGEVDLGFAAERAALDAGIDPGGLP